jgi:beta-glucosidase/6-phospho-beta-glucosidase/beta-galactosidase
LLKVANLSAPCNVIFTGRLRNDEARFNRYLASTIMDNFEWFVGVNARFGLLHIDFDKQLRTIRDNGYWWRDYLLQQQKRSTS